MRMEGFVKIMAMVRPAKGLKLSSCAFSFSFTCGSGKHTAFRLLLQAWLTPLQP